MKKFLSVLAVVFLASHVGLSLVRMGFWLYNSLLNHAQVDNVSLRAPYERIWGVASTDDQQIAICWLAVVVALSFWSWFAICWFGESRLTHTVPVLVLTILTAGWTYLVFTSYLPVSLLLILSCVFWVVVCGILWANVFGHRRASEWIHDKGRWWWTTVVRPSLRIPLLGALYWSLALVILWILCHLAPAGWYESILNVTEWPYDTAWHMLRFVGLIVWRAILSPILSLLI